VPDKPRLAPELAIEVLPMWQPWASLVQIGAKYYETRGYRLPDRLLGERTAIHATKTTDHLGAIEQQPFRRHLAAALADDRLLYIDDQLPLGALICSVVFTECIRITADFADQLKQQSPHEFAFGNYAPGRYAWALGDVITLPEPVLASADTYRASQGTFRVPRALLGLPPKPLAEQQVLL
jgi:hypothetical protein